ncbi:ATP-binding protein [Tuwongella immobilis]|uniref:histidine kinase n=1 Tax=Tuwongella immobilis TaxID=692036 RepID=A0A6C2YNU2_9BACT|nr:ATP-binding protein [Tuwongella immobilis]VIP02869.1 pas pac sensor hybrid histidine kinase : PAS domain S-box OS=Rivularia sp. PCC 7116 GN=Riv7116_4067 PE=4 SV=1: HisKA: HATPase_c [Tuwongella immobilis]VTS02695.1 pas pac sensor hybrid histidine kinase : PAS domain S-box OS=Rivularia sp. PCC 7116 GN=Riv7116_4067 PE=4 SV=1: HisKA: HATPase_c [Tuwongella immobilis]
MSDSTGSNPTPDLLSPDDYPAFLALMAEGVAISGSNRAFVLLNSAAESILRLPRRSEPYSVLEPLPWRRLIDLDGRAFPLDEWPVHRVFQTGQPIHNAVAGLDWPDGTVTWIQINAYPLNTATPEQPMRVISVFTDITRTIDSQRYWRLLAENIPEQILLVNRHRQVIRSNHHAAAPLEIQSIEAHGWIAPPELKNVIERELEATFQYAESRQCQFRDSAQRLWSLRVIPVSPISIVDTVLVVLQDITEQYALEMQIARAQRFESIGTLAMGLAHELNNLLTPVRMGVDLMRLDSASPPHPSILQTMAESIDRSSDLVRQILSLSRNQATIEQQRIRVSDWMSQAEERLRGMLDSRIELQFARSEAVLTIDGDLPQLMQMLQCLCINAQDAMPDGGRIQILWQHIPVNRSEINRTATPEQVEIIVADTGSGIRPEHRERIFDPFFTTKDPGQGTGLGLFSVQQIVRQHRGSIHVESEFGVGTQIRIRLPLAAEFVAESQS